MGPTRKSMKWTPMIIIYVIVYKGKYWLIVTDGQENH